MFYHNSKLYTFVSLSMSIRASWSSRRVSLLIRPRSILHVGVGVLAAGLALDYWSYSLPGYLRIIPRFRFGPCNIITPFRSISLFPTSQHCSMASLIPPQPAISWNHSVSEVTAAAKEVIAKDRQVLDQIAALPPKDCNFESVNYFVFLPVSTCLKYF